MTQGEGVILFGGSGFLGPYILAANPQMISVGRRPPPTVNRHIPIGSLENLDALRDVEFDKVIYIIGNTDHHDMEKEIIPHGQPTAFDYHTMSLIHTLEQLKQRKLNKFIHFSTTLLYDEHRVTLPVSENAPINPYKNRYVLSKYLAEEACKFYARWVPIINVRFCNLYGPTPLARFDLIHLLIRQLIDQGRGEVWNTKPARDFIYVEDAATAIVRLLDTDYTGNLILGSGVMTPVARVVDILRDISGCEIRDLDIPTSGPQRFQCDTTTLERLTGWKPQFGIEEGIRNTYERMLAWKATGRMAEVAA